MRASDILPDNVNELHRNGITLRKGSVAAFMANIRAIEDTYAESAQVFS